MSCRVVINSSGSCWGGIRGSIGCLVSFFFFMLGVLNEVGQVLTMSCDRLQLFAARVAELGIGWIDHATLTTSFCWGLA